MIFGPLERQVMRNIGKVILLSTVTLAALGCFAKSWAVEKNPAPERTLKVVGDGKITAVPDQADMAIQVTEEGEEVEDASSLVQAKVEKIFKTLKSFGILDKDTQTLNYSVSPKMRYDKGESQRVGYTVSNRIKVVVKNLALTGKILNAVIQDGVSTIDGPHFSFSNPAQLKIDALRAAVEDAQAKAEAIARTAGVDLGKVFSISQTSLTMPVPQQRIEMAAVQSLGAMNAQVPIATGENEVTAQVEVVYSLK